MSTTIEISQSPGGLLIVRTPRFIAIREADGTWEIGQSGLEYKYSINVYPGELEELRQLLEAMA